MKPQSTNSPAVKSKPSRLAVLIAAASIGSLVGSLMTSHQLDPSLHVRRANVIDDVSVSITHMNEPKLWPTCHQNPYSGALTEPLDVISNKAAKWIHNIGESYKEALE